jgi:mono/diheme cytochrome c family protein
MPQIHYLAALLCLAFGLAPSLPAEEPPTLIFGDVQPWLASHCIRCHGPKQKRGKVDLSIFRDEAGVLKQRKLWQRVLTQVDTQEMPPAGEPQLSAEQREQFVKWVRHTLSSADPTNLAERNPGKAPIRRLTRTEYNNSIRDLFGISFDTASAVGMPPLSAFRPP